MSFVINFVFLPFKKHLSKALMISSIHIEGFKSIREMTLALRPINILIGANGAGKSNFISFFKLLNNLYEKRLENYSLRKGAENLLYFGSKTTSHIYFKIVFSNTNAYECQLSPSVEGTLFIDYENVSFNSEKGSLFQYKDTWFPTKISANRKESFLKYNQQSMAKYVSAYMESFKSYHFHDTSENAPLRKPSLLSDNFSLREDGGNLPSFLYYLQEKHPSYFSQIESVIRMVAPYFERFNLHPDRFNDSIVKLEWFAEQHPDIPFNSTHLSDGTLRFMALATLLMQPSLPEVIIIDEPELGLHPFAINVLAGLIRKASARSQVIISTQSVPLVSNFEVADIITVDRKDNQSVFNNLDTTELSHWIEDFSLGELWEKSIINGQPY